MEETDCSAEHCGGVREGKGRGRERVLGWRGLLRISQKNNATVRLLKKQREKKVKTLNQRERPSHPSLWPVGTTPPTLQKKQGRLKKKKKKKPVDERLQGEAHFSESFAPSMEPHSGQGSVSSLTSRGSLLAQPPVLCPPQIAFFYLNKKSKVHFC